MDQQEDTSLARPLNALASAVVDEMGGTAEMARKCKVSMAVVSTWKRKGFPRHFEQYLRVAYPKLKAWKSHKA